MKNKLGHISFKIDSISRYRQELMGYAIFGVMWGHLMNVTWQPVILAQLARLIHTPGFLFLSGFGLYYSYRRNPATSSFYHKRLTRLLVPYSIIMYWFFIAMLAVGNISVGDFIGYLTATAFLYKGELTFATWYISVSVLLYLLFPLIYKFIFRSNTHIAARLSIITFVYSIFLLCMGIFFSDYWHITRIGYAKILIFPIGMYAGYLSYESKEVSAKWLMAYYIICIALAVIVKRWVDDEIFSLFRTLLSIPIFCCIFNFTNKSPFLQIIIHKPLLFMGKYSLELYLIHVVVFYAMRDLLSIAPNISMIVAIIFALIICKPTNWLIQKMHRKIA